MFHSNKIHTAFYLCSEYINNFSHKFCKRLRRVIYKMKLIS